MDESKFISLLCEYHAEDVFNPWAETDGVADIGIQAPMIRRGNLMTYLALRKNTEYIFMAEALGYQGGHFSGVALTCERMLLGYHTISPRYIFADYQPQRTSNPKVLEGTVRDKGFNEPTDTVVWGALLEQGLDPFKVVMWNIFPFHPHLPGDMLSNRTPTEKELLAGYKYFEDLRKMYPNAKIVAIGKKCSGTLDKFGVKCLEVPHPSMGGANRFREAIKKL